MAVSVVAHYSTIKPLPDSILYGYLFPTDVHLLCQHQNLTNSVLPGKVSVGPTTAPRYMSSNLT